MTEEMKNKTTEELLDDFLAEEPETNLWYELWRNLVERTDYTEFALQKIGQEKISRLQLNSLAKLNWDTVQDLVYEYGEFTHPNAQAELELMDKLADKRVPISLRLAIAIYGAQEDDALATVHLEGEEKEQYCRVARRYHDPYKMKHYVNIALFDPNGYIRYYVSQIYQLGLYGVEKSETKSIEYEVKSDCIAVDLDRAYNWIENEERDKYDEALRTFRKLLVYDDKKEKIHYIDVDVFYFNRRYSTRAIVRWLVDLPFEKSQVNAEDLKTILDLGEYIKTVDWNSVETVYKGERTTREKELGMTIEEYYEKMSKEVKKMDTRICDKCKQPIPKESLFCPKCGAMQKIRSAADSERVQQWNVKEKEKIQAEMDTYAQTEIGKIEKAYNYFKKNAAAYDDFNRYVQMAGIASKKTPTKGMGCAVAVVAMTVVFPTLAYIAVGVFQSGILVLISLIACIIASIVIYLKLKERSEMQIVDEQYEAEKKRDEALKKIQDYYRAYPGQCPVSIDYSHPRTLEYLYTLMNNRRADTVKEAINLMEEEMHRKRMETHQQELIYRTAQAGNAAQTAAFFSAMDFFTRR